MLFLALLAVAAQSTVLLGLLLALAGHRAPMLARLRASLADGIAPSATAMASVVAIVATLGSLYLSEVANFLPCRLCWYQRAAMYPLGPLLAVAAWRGWHRLRPMAIAVAAVGASVSAYHVLLERYPTLGSGVCDPNNPCTLVWVRRFGYLTIPGMALSGFLLIISLLVTARSQPNA